MAIYMKYAYIYTYSHACGLCLVLRSIAIKDSAKFGAHFLSFSSIHEHTRRTYHALHVCPRYEVRLLSTQK